MEVSKVGDLYRGDIMTIVLWGCCVRDLVNLVNMRHVGQFPIVVKVSVPGFLCKSSVEFSVSRLKCKLDSSLKHG